MCRPYSGPHGLCHHGGPLVAIAAIDGSRSRHFRRCSCWEGGYDDPIHGSTVRAISIPSVGIANLYAGIVTLCARGTLKPAFTG